jgi:hypothetical protein
MSRKRLPWLSERWRAMPRNAAMGITGLLLASSRYFIQVLEGDARQINALYLRIAADPRHERVQLMGYTPIQRRQYPVWAMSLAPFEHTDVRAASWHAPSALASPYELDTTGLHVLIGKAQARLMLARQAAAEVPARYGT